MKPVTLAVYQVGDTPNRKQLLNGASKHSEFTVHFVRYTPGAHTERDHSVITLLPVNVGVVILGVAGYPAG